MPDVIPESAAAQFGIVEIPQDHEDRDIISLLSNSGEEEMSVALTQTVQSDSTKITKQIVQKRSSPRVPMFYNCKLEGTINININKK